MSSSSAEQQNNNIDLDRLSLDQLDQLKTSEEARLQAFMQQYSTLRAAAAKLNSSQTAVSELSPAKEGEQVMVPLTASLYVPGTVQEPNKLLVDLGTGFYAEKSTKQTQEFLERKLKLVSMNSENVAQAIQQTRQNLQQIQFAMQGKMMEIRARQEGQKVMKTDGE